MHCVINALACAIGLAAALGTMGEARATPFNAAEAGLVLGDTIIDSDFAFLAQSYGAFPDTIDFSITAGTTSFTSSMSGTYGGTALSISYTGDLSAYPGTITWAGSGSYGADLWASSGTATFSFPTASTFQELYSSSSSVGSHTETTSLTVTGTDEPDVLYTGTTGTAVADGVQDCYVNLSLRFPNGLPPKVGDPTQNDGVKGTKVGRLCVGDFVLTTDRVNSVIPPSGPPSMIVDAGTATVTSQVVPEPPGALTLLIGSLALLGASAMGKRHL